MKRLIITLVSLIMMGCQQTNINEEKLSVVPLDDRQIAMEVNSTQTTKKSSNEKEIKVREHVKGNDVYVECIISNFKFSKRDKKNGDGFLSLYLNGKKIDEIYTAAFIVKGLPTGKHSIKIELVHNDGTSYGEEEEFEVTI